MAEEIPVLALGQRGLADVVATQDDGPDVYRAQLEIAGVGAATTVRLNRYRRIPSLQTGQRVSVAYTRGGDGQPPRAVPLTSAARWPGAAMAAGFGAFLLWLARRK
ncbi:MAG: hypothetical protein IT162_14160 [Bryobacterales bacterium]|nr:hypothetical protein [Bryobacterales bacterium]